MKSKITDSIYYVGANDHDIDMFEGQYVVPDGMAYNSYVIADEKTAVFETIDKSKTEEWLGNLEEVLDGTSPDYLIIQHMEPDHSASIAAFLEKYPNVTVAANPKAFKMIEQFFPDLTIAHKLDMEDGGKLSLGRHELNFIFAPMVHWPEVVMTYESSEKILFSADAFGKFGAVKPCENEVCDMNDDWACEARRYYFGIVGKYGPQVQAAFAKTAGFDICRICPLHGPVLSENLEYYFDLYNTWANYDAESKGVCICYTSVYGNTAKAVKLLASKLKEKGVEIVEVSDLARCDMAEAVEDAFRYDRLVLATTTYNGDIFPFMRQFIDHLTERNYQKRKVAFVQNGTWGPAATRIMKGMFEKSKELTFCENEVTIKSALNDESAAQLEALAEELK